MMDTKFTIRNRTVRDSLDSIGLYSPDYGYKLVVNGGIAIQLYISPHRPDLVRPTHDTDLLVYPRLDSKIFRDNVGKKLAERLQSYNPSINILRHVYEVELEDPDKKPFFVHSYKWTENGFEKNKRDIERQVSNANKMKIPNSNNMVYAVRPEDLIVGKFDRIEKIRAKGLFPESAETSYRIVNGREWEKLEEEDLINGLVLIVKNKNNLPAYLDRGEEEFKKAMDEYVSLKDVFDISVIVKLASMGKLEFDEKYYDGISKKNVGIMQ